MDTSNSPVQNLNPVVPLTEQPTSLNQQMLWYRNWKSWVSILLMVFFPIPIVGVILMWIIAPWSVKTKRILSFIFIGLPIIIGFIFYLVMFRGVSSPGGSVDRAVDMRRKSDIESIARAARSYCVEKQQCPSSIDQLTQTDFSSYLHIIPTDPKTGDRYFYELDSNKKDCVIKTVLSTGENYSIKCI